MVSVFGGLRKAALAVGVMFGITTCGPMDFAGPSFDSTKPVPVALLVPGGADGAGDAILAQALENAARLAVADLQGVQIDLKVYQTGGIPAQAAAVAMQAVDEGARIILGPVYADAANAVGVAVAPRGVNVLSFSNNTEIAGGNVFVLGNTFENTADRLVSYAARQGKGSVFVVSEQTPAGEVGRRAIETAIARSSATLAGSESYAFNQDAVVAAVPRLVASVRASNAQSVFLTADSAGALPLLAQLLPEAGLGPDSKQFIGLTRWDIPPATLSFPGVQGGWFALPDPSLNNQFQARYGAAYGGPAHPIAGLAYDGVAAIGALVRSRGAEALTASALTQGSGFVGVSGIFRFLPDGTNERGLAVAEIRNSQVVVIDPAPRSFIGTGF